MHAALRSDTAISPATPTVGAARVYQKLTPADKQELIMSSTLSLESTTCVSTDDYTAQQFAAYSQPGFSMADQVQKQLPAGQKQLPFVRRRTEQKQNGEHRDRDRRRADILYENHCVRNRASVSVNSQIYR